MSKFPSDIKAASEFLSDHGFEYHSDLRFIDSQIEVEESLFHDTGKGAIIFWLKITERNKVKNVELVYIGYTEKTIVERLKQHMRSISRASMPQRYKGQVKKVHKYLYSKIKKAFEDSSAIKIYALKSEQKSTFNTLERLYEMKKKALIKNFNPSWNQKNNL